MAFCSKCGCPIDDDATVCPSCGASVKEPSAEEKAKAFLNTPDHSSEFSEEDASTGKVVNVLAYLGITFWLPLVVEPKTALGRFHANQGLLVLIVSILLSVVGSLFAWIPVLGSIIGALCSIISFFYCLFGVINTINGKAKELPLIGKIKLLK